MLKKLLKFRQEKKITNQYIAQLNQLVDRVNILSNIKGIGVTVGPNGINIRGNRGIGGGTILNTNENAMLRSDDFEVVG